MASLCSALIQAQARAEVEPLLRECLTLRTQALPDDWLTFNPKSLLGGALLDSVALADVNPDGILDLATANHGGASEVSLLRSQT